MGAPVCLVGGEKGEGPRHAERHEGRTRAHERVSFGAPSLSGVPVSLVAAGQGVKSPEPAQPAHMVILDPRSGCLRPARSAGGWIISCPVLAEQPPEGIESLVVDVRARVPSDRPIIASAAAEVSGV